MAKQRDFNNFLSEIEPSSTTVAYISSLQSTLRDYLKNHDTYKKIHIPVQLILNTDYYIDETAFTGYNVIYII